MIFLFALLSNYSREVCLTDIGTEGYTLSLDTGIPLTIEALAGKQAFVRLDWSYGIDRVPIPQLSKVEEAEARREMKYLSYITGKKIHSNLVPKSDPTESFQPQLRTRDYL